MGCKGMAQFSLFCDLPALRVWPAETCPSVFRNSPSLFLASIVMTEKCNDCND